MSAVRAVLKWTVFIGDGWQTVGSGHVVHVGQQPGNSDVLQVWTEEVGEPVEGRVVAVFGTGHPIPPLATHVGSVIAGHLVWHVYEEDTR